MKFPRRAGWFCFVIFLPTTGPRLTHCLSDCLTVSAELSCLRLADNWSCISDSQTEEDQASFPRQTLLSWPVLVNYSAHHSALSWLWCNHLMLPPHSLTDHGLRTFHGRFLISFMRSITIRIKLKTPNIFSIRANLMPNNDKTSVFKSFLSLLRHSSVHTPQTVNIFRVKL